MELSTHISGAVRESIGRLISVGVQGLPTLITVALLFLIFWGLARAARWLASACSARVDDQTVRLLITHVTYYLVWAVGFIVIFDAMGLQLESVVTALGLGGVAIGFALKDILSNLVSGVLILAMRPFEIGDQIVVADTEGTVERIELRATHIRTYDGRLVLVPNGDVFTSRITNNTASPVRRASVFVYVGYGEDTERAMAVILDTIRSVPGVADTPPPSMRLRELHPESVQVEARFWADSKRTHLMNTASAARVAIMRALKDAGIQLPNPDQRVVTFAAAPPGLPTESMVSASPLSESQRSPVFGTGPHTAGSPEDQR